MKKYYPYLIIFILGFIAYGNTLKHGYVLDDMAIIANHTHVQNGVGGIPEILTTNYLHGVQEYNDGLYRPLSVVFFAIQNQMSPNNPMIPHFLNIIYAILIAVMVFKIFVSVFQTSQKVGLGMSLLFLVLPVHTEVVANVKSSDELLALLFVLLSFWFFDKYIKGQKSLDLLIGSGFFFVALFSKESTFSFVGIIPAILFWLNQESKKQVGFIAGITVALGAVFLFIRHQVLSSMPNEVDEGTMSALNNSILATPDVLEKLGTALWLQVLYLIKIVLPYSLQHDYSFNAIEIVSVLSAKGLAGLAVVILLAYSAWRFRNSDPLISVGIAWYFGSLLIVSNLIFPIGATFAERFVFTPSLGVLIVLVGVLKKYKMEVHRPKGYTVALIALIALFTMVTISRNRDWKDNFTLYSADYAKLKNSARGNYNYGTVCQEQAAIATNPREKTVYFSEAQTALNRALTIYPKYWDAYNNLSLLYSNNGQFKEAVSILQQLTRKNETYQKGWYNMGSAYFNMADYVNAKMAFDNYCNLNPNNPDAWYFCGMCMGYQNDFSSAIGLLNKSIALNPNHQDALLMLGKAYGIQGDYIQSKTYFEQVLRVNPNNAEAINNLNMTNQIISSQ